MAKANIEMPSKKVCLLPIPANEIAAVILDHIADGTM